MSSNSIVGQKRQSEDSEVHYYGEESCAHAGCSFKAYYRISGGELLCGVHSRNKPRSQLLKNPLAQRNKEKAYSRWEEEDEITAKANRDANRKGTLTVSKLRMRRAVDHTTGVYNVFPNYRDQYRAGGFGCSSLSPMLLGPVQHGQPGVPDSKTLENYHQFNKVFRCDMERRAQGKVFLKKSFYEIRDNAYLDPVGHRHKYPGKKDTPVFSYHLTKKGEARWYNYVESRYFYCHQYELLAKEKEDFRALRHWLDQGYNLQIVGYDGNPAAKPGNLWELYNSTEHPFGHELVLFSLLVIEDPKQYPWNRFYEENKPLYE